MAKKILIIKLGYCETLINERGFVPSLGDVFRHTVLLHRYARAKVTWLTSASALPLLKDNPLIHEVITYNNGQTSKAFADKEYDIIINLEKAPRICSLARSIKARKRLGFDWDGETTAAHPSAQSVLDIANGKDHYLPIQALLYQMVGDYWRGEDYSLGYQPRPHVPFDIGLNYRVGGKWPTKAWPERHWKELERLCQAKGLTVSWQEGEKDLYDYMDWVNAGRLVVTCDSLGMHLGLGMKKKVVALFGSTPSDNIYMYGRGIILKANGICPQAPCLLPECHRNGICMSEIQPGTVFQVILNLLEPATMTTRRVRQPRRTSPPAEEVKLQGAVA